MNTTPFVPADEPAERALLGCVVLAAESDAQSAVKMLADLEPADFNSELHREIFRRLVRLAAAGDPPTQHRVLEDVTHLALRQLVLRLTDPTEEWSGSAADFPHQVERVKKIADQRVLVTSCAETLEYLQSGAIDELAFRERLRGMLDIADTRGGAAHRQPLIQFLTPAEIIHRPIPEGIVLVGDYHVTRGDICVIGGHGGVGKSIALTDLAVAGAAGGQWMGMRVHRPFKTLIIQNENGPVRLKNEYAARNLEQFSDSILISDPPPLGMIFGRDDFRADIRRHIAQFEPDIVAIDPFSNITLSDKKTDYEDAFTYILDCLPKGALGPAIVIVAHTRKPQGQERSSGRALLHLLAGSYILTSRPRSAFILQAATDDPQDDRVVWTCCKNSNGEMGPRFAFQRTRQGFVQLQHFDWDEFDDRDAGGRPPKITEEHLATVFHDGNRRLARPNAAKELATLTGAKEGTCHNVLSPDGRFADCLSYDSNRLLTFHPSTSPQY